MAYPLTGLLAYHFVIVSVPWITKSYDLLNSLKLSEEWGVGCGITETAKVSVPMNGSTFVDGSQRTAVKWRNKRRDVESNVERQ